MTEKNEDQIAREKEAVQKMVGAKSAMESALARIKTLESAIEKMGIYLDDMARVVGDGAGFMTFHTEKGGTHGFVSIRSQSLRIAEIGRKVL